MSERLGSLKSEIQQIWGGIEAEGRESTPQERKDVERLLKAVEHETIRERIDGPGGQHFRDGDGGGTVTSAGGPGDRFIASEGFKAIAKPNGRAQAWSTGAVDIGTLETKDVSYST